MRKWAGVLGMIGTSVACARTQDTGHLRPVTDTQIQNALTSGLTPGDLSSANRLTKKVTSIGRKTRDFALYRGDLPGVRPVERGSREWIVLLSCGGPSHDLVPCVEFWIGARGKKVVTQLPPDTTLEELDGSLVGEWRRRGPYLVGAGFDIPFHAQNFGEGDVLVFRETASGIEPRQRREFRWIKDPVKFVSRRSMDLLCRDENGDSQTLAGYRWESPTRVTGLKFVDGRYKAVSSYTDHDDLWAFDRLATAIAEEDFLTVRRMIPKKRVRKGIVPKIWRALRDGQTVITDELQGGLGLRGTRGTWGYTVLFAKVHGRWIVRSFGRDE